MKYLNGNYYVEVKDKRYKKFIQLKTLDYVNEILQLLSELNIKFKMRLKFVKIRKLSEMIRMN